MRDGHDAPTSPRSADRLRGDLRGVDGGGRGVRLLDEGAGERRLRDGLRVLLIRDDRVPAARVDGRATRLRAPVAIESAPGGGCSCRSQEQSAVLG
jgi:hypothetical protein